MSVTGCFCFDRSKKVEFKKWRFWRWLSVTPPLSHNPKNSSRKKWMFFSTWTFVDVRGRSWTFVDVRGYSWICEDTYRCRYRYRYSTPLPPPPLLPLFPSFTATRCHLCLPLPKTFQNSPVAKKGYYGFSVTVSPLPPAPRPDPPTKKGSPHLRMPGHPAP